MINTMSRHFRNSPSVSTPVFRNSNANRRRTTSSFQPSASPIPLPNKEVQRLDGAFVYQPHPASYNSYEDDYNYLDYEEDYLYGEDYGYDYSNEGGVDYSQEYDNKVGRRRKRKKKGVLYNPGSKYSKYVPGVVKEMLAKAFLANPEPYLKQLQQHERQKKRRRQVCFC